MTNVLMILIFTFILLISHFLHGNIPRAPSLMLLTFLSLFGLQECLLLWLLSMFVETLTTKLLQHGYQYHKLRKTSLSFIVDTTNCFLNTGQNTYLLQGLSKPEFYGGLVHKFNKIVRKSELSEFSKIVML